MAEPLGRPKTLNRRHKVELPFDMEEVKELVQIHETAQIAKGFLSTNAGVIIATFGAITAMLAFPPTQRLATEFIAFWRNQITSFIVDSISGVIPGADKVAEEAAKAAEAARKAAEDAWRRIQEALAAEQALQESQTGEAEEATIGPVILPGELTDPLEGEGEQPPA